LIVLSLKMIISADIDLFMTEQDHFSVIDCLIT
jgi:hypothetical protein